MVEIATQCTDLLHIIEGDPPEVNLPGFPGDLHSADHSAYTYSYATHRCKVFRPRAGIRVSARTYYVYSEVSVSQIGACYHPIDNDEDTPIHDTPSIGRRVP